MFRGMSPQWVLAGLTFALIGCESFPTLVTPCTEMHLVEMTNDSDVPLYSDCDGWGHEYPAGKTVISPGQTVQRWIYAAPCGTHPLVKVYTERSDSARPETTFELPFGYQTGQQAQEHAHHYRLQVSGATIAVAEH